jgi:hypothetical protein
MVVEEEVGEKVGGGGGGLGVDLARLEIGGGRDVLLVVEPNMKSEMDFVTLVVVVVVPPAE